MKTNPEIIIVSGFLFLDNTMLFEIKASEYVNLKHVAFLSMGRYDPHSSTYSFVEVTMTSGIKMTFERVENIVVVNMKTKMGEL